MESFKGKPAIIKNASNINKSPFLSLALILSFMLLFFNFLPSISSDLISVNAGGDNEKKGKREMKRKKYL